MKSNACSDDKVSVFQLALVVLSVVVLMALGIDAVAPISGEVSKLLQILDTGVCIIFFGDFVFRFTRADNKAAFMKWGWIDLFASIPAIDIFRVGRLVRVLRIIRLLRGVRVTHRLLTVIMQDKPKSAAASVVLTTILLVTFSSIGMLVAESEASQRTVNTAEDAIWWSVSTITTVGYGDKYPTTTEGRIIAMILMLSGVGLFGMLSGLVASLFMGNQPESSEELRRLERKLDILRETLGNVAGAPNDRAVAPVGIRVDGTVVAADRGSPLDTTKPSATAT